MANYDDAAFDDDLADDWETALQAEEDKEAAQKAEEREREAAKAERAARKKKATADDDEEENADDRGEGAEDMKAKAMDAEAGQDLLGGGQRVPLAQKKIDTDAARQSFAEEFSGQVTQHQEKSLYCAMMPNLVRGMCDALSMEDLQELARAIKVAASNKKSAPKKTDDAAAGGRGRNVDMDAFDGVTDRGGAAITEHEDFM